VIVIEADRGHDGENRYDETGDQADAVENLDGKIKLSPPAGDT
jgi:hypothetical protein